MRLASGGDGLFSAIIALFIVDYHFQRPRLVLHVIPAQAVAVQSVLLGKCFVVELAVLILFDLLDASLALAIDEELGFIVVGIAVDGSHLAPALLAPAPVRQQVYGVSLLLPVRAIEIVAVLGQAGEVADAEVAAARRPVAVVGSRLAQVVEASPYELADHPVVVVLPAPVVVGQVRP